MREIKFRAWDKLNKQMCDVIDFSCMNYPEKYEVMQLTGLKDKNGKEIYEGDIVKGRWLSGTIAFSKSYAGWSVVNGSMFERNFEDCEVIGNIYENPELLEK